VKLRDSGISWLGELPAHWDVWKVGHLARVGNGSTPERDNTDYWTDGSLPWLNSSVVNQAEVMTAEQFVTELARKECHLPLLYPGTVLVAITGQGKTRGQAVVLSIEATINQHMAFVAPNPALMAPWFLRWAFYRAYEYLRSISDDAGGTKGALTCEDVASLKIPVPPLEEQRAIVARLAHETTRLDALLAAKQRLLDLLAEKRKAIIATAITRGLDPKVKLRDSGVPWLGVIPAHWPLVPLRYLVSFLSGGTPDKGNADFWSGGTIPWVSPKDMKVEVIDDSEDHITEAAIDGSATRIVPVGSVLVVVRGMILAHTLPVAVTSGPVTINQDIKALGCSERLLPDFLRIVLAGQSRLLLSLADSSAHGTKKLETEVLQQLEVPVPALSEQQAIVEHIAHETAKLDAVRAATERTIALLKERRSALIAAAVTGQIDVGVAA